MATQPVSDNPRVAEHYAAVVALNKALVEAMRGIPAQTTGPDLELLAQVIEAYALVAIADSADYYEDLRELAGVASTFVTPIVEPPAPATIEASMAAAVAAADLAPDLDETAVNEAVQNLLEGLAQTLVMEAGRDEVWTAIENDAAAKGWARVTRPGACAFCRMLATRGAVYKTERSASFQAHHADEHGGGDCQCGVEPLFAGRYEPPAHVRADQALWSEVTGDVRGPDKLKEFRRAVEGRSDGPRRRQRTRRRP